MQAGLGGAGVGVLVMAMHAAIPFALVVTLLSGGFFYKALESRMRDRVLGHVRVQIDRRYRDVIPDTVAQFNLAWKCISEQMIATLEAEFNANLDALKDQLNSLTQNFNTLSADKDGRLKSLNLLDSKLSNAAESLRSIVRKREFSI